MQGEAEVSAAPEHLACFKEAELVVRVKVTDLWMNCPRYIHRYQKLKTSRYVPQAGVETPLCEWKRIDGIQDVLRPHEIQQVAQSGGTIPIEEWIGRVVTGKSSNRAEYDNAAGAVSGGVVRLFARRLLARYGVGPVGQIVNHGGHASGVNLNLAAACDNRSFSAAPTSGYAFPAGLALGAAIRLGCQRRRGPAGRSVQVGHRDVGADPRADGGENDVHPIVGVADHRK